MEKQFSLNNYLKN